MDLAAAKAAELQVLVSLVAEKAQENTLFVGNGSSSSAAPLFAVEPGSLIVVVDLAPPPPCIPSCVGSNSSVQCVAGTCVCSEPGFRYEGPSISMLHIFVPPCRQ
jgi:hypothetical protein